MQSCWLPGTSYALRYLLKYNSSQTSSCLINRPFPAVRVVFSVHLFQGKSSISIGGAVLGNAHSGISQGSIVNHFRHVEMTTFVQRQYRLLHGMGLGWFEFL